MPKVNLITEIQLSGEEEQTVFDALVGKADPKEALALARSIQLGTVRAIDEIRRTYNDRLNQLAEASTTRE
jgi:hypothetical protein